MYTVAQSIRQYNLKTIGVDIVGRTISHCGGKARKKWQIKVLRHMIDLAEEKSWCQ